MSLREFTVMRLFVAGVSPVLPKQTPVKGTLTFVAHMTTAGIPLTEISFEYRLLIY